MGYKVMVALIVLLLLVCNSTQVYSEVSSMVELQKSLSMAYPAASCYGPLDEPHSASLAVDNEITSRKLLRGVGRRLREEKLSSAESRSENSRWTTRILHHLGQSASHALHKVWHSENGIASHQFSEPKPSSRSALSGIQAHVVGTGAEDQSDTPKLQTFEKQGRKSDESFLDSLYSYKQHKSRASLLEVSKKKSPSAHNNINKSSNAETATGEPSPPQESDESFVEPHSASQSSKEDDITDITGMDYSPARKKPPIHN